jgi:small subunit ribosomal protein S6
MVITAPDGTPEELLATVDQIVGYITTAGGSILRSNSDSPWGRRRLAYPIRYQSSDVRDGFYTLIHLEIAPDKVIEIERDLKLNDRLMRYMVIQLASEPVFPEPVEEEEGGEGAEVGDAAPADDQTAQDSEVTVDTAPTEADAEAAEATAETSEATAEDRRSLVSASEAAEVETLTETDAEAVDSAESKE